MKKIILILILLVPIKSKSCSCTGTEDLSVSVKRSDAIFSGRVISKAIKTILADSLWPNGIKYSFFETKFKVVRIFKGNFTSDTIIITSGLGHGDCGYPFDVGNYYVVYARNKDRYFASGKLTNHFFLYRYLYADNGDDKKGIEEFKEIFLKRSAYIS